MSELRVFKAHGLGNDYLVLEQGPPVTADLARALCHRHHGPGGDGLLEPFHSDQADAGIRIWNPDGSIAEKSGNGLRIASYWLHHHQGLAARHRVDTGFDVVTSHVEGDHVTVQMGQATFDPRQIPTAEPVLRRPLTIDGHPLEVTAVGTGNPHAVVFVDTPDLDALPWRAWGEHLETHPWFPNRTNVQIAFVVGPSEVNLRIWERGAGPTLASGSSSCGVAAAAVYTHRIPSGRVKVTMPGGTLFVTVSDDLQLVLEGPVAPVGTTRLHPAFSLT